MFVVRVSFIKFVISFLMLNKYLLLHLILVQNFFFWKRFPNLVGALGPTNPRSAPDGCCMANSLIYSGHQWIFGHPCGSMSCKWVPFNILIAVKTKWQQQKIKTLCARQQKQTSDFTRVITAIPNSVFIIATYLFIVLARMYFYALVSYHAQAFWLSIAVRQIAPKPNALRQQLFHSVLWSLTSGRVIRTSSKGNYLPGRSGGGDITCCHLSSSEEWLWEIEGRSSHSEHLYLKTDPETGREGRSGVGLGRCLRSAQICQDMMKLLWKD